MDKIKIDVINDKYEYSLIESFEELGKFLNEKKMEAKKYNYTYNGNNISYENLKELILEKGIFIKFSDDKTPYNLCGPAFWDIVEGAADILGFGAKKYGADNFSKVGAKKGIEIYKAAAMRHFLAWFNGEQKDSESGSHHFYHLLCCLYFIRYFEMEKEKNDN